MSFQGIFLLSLLASHIGFAAQVKSLAPITVENAWLISEETSEDLLKGIVTYTPNATTPRCESIRMIQIARVEIENGNDLEWHLGEAPRNQMRTAADSSRGILPGYFVDHQAYTCRNTRTCSPYYRDHWANADESQDGKNTESERRPASLSDYPYGWQNMRRITLEACAQCADNQAILGCAVWGGHWPMIGAREILPVRVSDSPSATFTEALRLFQEYYAR